MVGLVGCGGGGATDEEMESSSSIVVEREPIEEIETPSLLTDIQKQILQSHNENRNHYFTDSNLTYSLKLENAAQLYADTLANSGAFEHDPSNHTYDYGENLYANSQNEKLTIEKSMFHWYDEEKPLYDYETGDCREEYYANGSRIKCGHYTQVIWQDSREVGCATSQYKTGDLVDGYVYVCKYHKGGNSTFNGEKEKPYCSEYDKKDLYGLMATSFANINFSGKSFPIEIIEEDRVTCQRKDSYNSAMVFGEDMRSVTVENFQIFNNGQYPNTLSFDKVVIGEKTIKFTGKNSNIVDTRFKGKNIYMSFTLIGETADYYATEMEWNGLDSTLPKYSRSMLAKIYK
jgi:hypothetical protein